MLYYVHMLKHVSIVLIRPGNIQKHASNVLNQATKILAILNACNDTTC